MRSSIEPVWLLTSVVVASVFAGGVSLSGQSLGRLATEEAARRKALASPARVITEDDLGTAAAPPSAAAPSASSTSDPADAAPVKRRAVAAAKFTGGALPQIPIQAVSAGEVVLEVSVSKAGRVTAVKPLRHTAPFTDAVAAAVRTWTFAPAQDAPVTAPGVPPDPSARTPMNSTVLVVAVFRPPALFSGTLGEPPKTVAKPSGAAPVLAGSLVMPAYPPRALYDGVVLLELDVAAHGGVSGIGVVRRSAAFDQAAIEAASALAFVPARVHGQPTPAFVYVVAAFRQPIT